ncbi:MAG: protein glxC [Alphaproteobacteria bacterium]|nr:protein glxC [Alphaproteobacteria bacterium]
MNDFDLDVLGITGVNQRLHALPADANDKRCTIRNPMGQHAIACGLDGPLQVEVMGHVGFYCGGMNKQAELTIHGHAGVGVAENMMSGRVWVKGNASESAGATGNGGLLVIDGDAASRCGISMKGIDIVVGGSVGHMSAFMAQRGNLVVCGDAGDALGDSIYEARLYIKGNVASLGADCIEKDMRDEHLEDLARLLESAGRNDDPRQFRRYGSARRLYNFDVDHADAY